MIYPDKEVQLLYKENDLRNYVSPSNLTGPLTYRQFPRDQPSTYEVNYENISTLWKISGNSIFLIPANTSLIAFGLRLLFCKLELELMRTILFLIIGILYLTSTIGLIQYVVHAKLDLLKEFFFLQYIILTISLVLGMIAELIAFIMMSFYFMRLLQTHIKKVSHLYLLEE